MPTLRERFPALASGVAAVLVGLAAGATPPPQTTVDGWAEEHRRVSPESGSPYPGAWSNARVPYTTEIQRCLSFDDPCRQVVFKKSHQVAGTELGLNLFGYVVDQQPCPVVIVLPTLDEAKRYNKIKLAPTIEATPRLRHRVADQKSRDESGSTATFKRFRGGYCQVTGANSSRGLQMISGRVLIADEISEWPDDVDGRGDPLSMAEKRLTAWDRRGPKRFYLSTPDVKGTCRISERYERSDQRRYYVPCPQCGTYQVLDWRNLRWRSDEPPHGAHFVCPANGCVVEHADKAAMIAAGRWVKTYEDAGAEPGPAIAPEDLERYRARSSRGREPGFAIWQAYSPFTDWDGIASGWLEAKGDPYTEKVFVQQVLGEAYEESGEAPDHELLMHRREPYPLGRVPPGALVLTGMADVQANRLEWAVYGWGPGMTGWLVDVGILMGDPSQDEVWRQLGDVTRRTYEDAYGGRLPVTAFGVDAGYLSPMVYAFARARPGVYALDGRPGSNLPAIGTPSVVDINLRGRKVKKGAKLWPTGAHGLKSWIYGALRKTIDGPDPDGNWPRGSLRFPEACSAEFFKQLTAEHLVDVERRGRTVKEWKQRRGQPNEQLDIAVGARALGALLKLDQLADDDAWRRAYLTVCVARGDVSQGDLFALRAAAPAPEARAEEAAPAPRPRVLSRGVQ